MKRLPGVIFSAIIRLLVSLLQLLMALAMGIGGAVEQSQIRSGVHPGVAATPPIPTWMPIFTYGLCVVFAALTVWAILTVVGLFRMRRWARYSILAIGGCLALVGLPAMLVSLLMLAVPLSVPAGGDASQVHNVQAMTKVVFGVVGLFYGMIGAVGVSWLVYFNRKKVCDEFNSALGQSVPSRRPFLVSAIAVLTMIGGPGCLLMALLPLPGAFLGLTLYGWQRALVFLVYAVLVTAAGVGLWRLEEWGRRLAMAMQLVGLAQFIVYLVRPSLMKHYSLRLAKSVGISGLRRPGNGGRCRLVAVGRMGTA